MFDNFKMEKIILNKINEDKKLRDNYNLIKK